MARRSLLIAVAVVVAALGLPTTAAADNVFGMNIGYFFTRDADGRSSDDVIWNNLDFLAFYPDEFDGFTFGGEYYFGLGDYIEVGGGVSYYQESVWSVYADYVDDDGTEIEQDLKLRIVPVTAMARFFPLSRNAPVQPYVGAGIGWFSWRYSETGEFVDFSDFAVFRGNYVDSGWAVGPVVVAGVRFPIAPQFLVGGEFKWQDAEGDLDESQGFAGSTIDLGGYSALFTFNVRF